ncbi:MAG: phosphatidylserine/phosphatidylglycerophosphate/cardiolipin synthase family protein [Oligoflexia bacterium]|nr:phosphatidylserine/phosphatidylglycerophosphate/cardiolipin synthase family protein [Oligoflexia bacterium]
MRRRAFPTSIILSLLLCLGAAQCPLAQSSEPDAFFSPGEAARIRTIPQDELASQLFELIEKADREILAVYYIVQNDDTGRGFLARLIEAAKRGVDVKLIIDGIGTGPFLQITARTCALLVKGGVKVSVYHPKLSMIRKARRRLHNKLLLIDRREAVIGSSNIWNWSSLGRLFESDVIISSHDNALEAPARHFFEIWNSSEVVETLPPAPVPFNPEVPPDTNPLTEDDVERFVREGRKVRLTPRSHPFFTRGEEFDESSVVYLHDGAKKRSDWGVFPTLLELIASSRKTIDIVNPYPMFVERLKRAIGEAVSRGVKVRIVTASAEALGSEFAGVRGAYLSQIPYFARTGLDVWEFQPSYLHSKYLIVDGQRAYFGSSNLDQISADYNLENGILVTREGEYSGFIRSLETEFEALLRHSVAAVRDGRSQLPPRSCFGLCQSWRLFYPDLSASEFAGG